MQDGSNHPPHMNEATAGQHSSTSASVSTPKPTRAPRGVRVAGHYLLRLRIARGWTREQAAKLAGLSEKAVQRAEKDGPIELQTLERLAAIYDTHLNTLTQASVNSSQPALVLTQYLNDVWSHPEQVARHFHEHVIYHCELGQLNGIACVLARLRDLRQKFGRRVLHIELGAQTESSAACRWQVSDPATASPSPARVGTTVIELREGKIAEAWEFLAPLVPH